MRGRTNPDTYLTISARWPSQEVVNRSRRNVDLVYFSRLMARVVPVPGIHVAFRMLQASKRQGTESTDQQSTQWLKTFR